MRKSKKEGIYNIINKWKTQKIVGVLPRKNKSKRLITRAGLIAINNTILDNNQLNTQKIKSILRLKCSERSIRRYIKNLGWNKINTKYSLCLFLYSLNIFIKY